MSGSRKRSAPASGGADGGLERALASFVSSLASDFSDEADAGRLHGAISAVMLRTVLGAILAPDDVVDGEPSFRRSLDRAAAFTGSIGATSPAFAPSPLVERVASIALASPEPRAALSAIAHAAQGPTARRSALGELHQALLEFETVRMEGPAVRTATGAWLRAGDVLRVPPAKRSKWVQRAAGLPKAAVEKSARALSRATTESELVSALASKHPGGVHLAGTRVVVSRGVARRRSGSHYTPEVVRRSVVERTFAPLVKGRTAVEIRSLRICDPAMGAGDFLLTTVEWLAREIGAGAVAELAAESVFGVDRDPVAVDLARIALCLLVASDGAPPPDLSTRLVTGDSLTGLPRSADDAAPVRDAVDLPRVFGSVFRERGGFDACVGNPPWVAYAGRAAQPLAPALARYYARENPAFFGYRTLHGLFVYRSAQLLRAGGRLGLVLPTSVADLEGYAATRRAHDALADADEALLDFGDGVFAEVFQPAMALTSTRREAGTPGRTPPGTWKLARRDLDGVAEALLARLSTLPTLSPSLFGERGFQTTGDDLAHLRRLDAPEPPFVLPIREGTDVGEFRLGAPRLHLDPGGLTGRLRSADEFRSVRVLIRQTARYPIAALSDGLAFRNSILAGFSNAEWTGPALAAYLNSSAVRWYHFTRNRDARQGMPQLKIGHLRALPHLADAAARERLGELGERSLPLSPADRETLDDAVADALSLTEAERALVRRFATEHPLPVPRRR